MFEALNWLGGLTVLAIWMYLPAAIANMFPVVVPKKGILQSLFVPIDFGLKLGGQRVFGEHKTFGGVIAGIVGGILTALILKFTIFLNVYSLNVAIWYGFLSGAGALIGDLVKSFIKRRFKIKDGGVLPVLDQLDFILGATIFLTLGGFEIPLDVFLIVIIFTPLLHLGVNIVAYRLGLKKVWW